MKSKKYNLKNVIHKAKTKGMIGVSSHFLIDKMLKHIDFSKDITLVQFGSGKAVFQKRILPKLSPNSRLFVFEINDNLKKFGNQFSQKNYHYITDSAENMEKYIDGEVDVIISTLPFGSLPKTITKNILCIAEKNLKTGGIFLQYQYFLQNKKDIEKTFGKKVNLAFEWRNIPPAFIYTIKK